MNLSKDVVGLGFRWDLAQEIVNNIDHHGDVECLELIAEDFFRANDAQIKGLKTLSNLLPVALHGVTLGLASTVRCELRRADGMARLCEAVDPACWSEHLSFVRSGPAEIGHLAAPPRSQATIEGALANIERLTAHVGRQPLLENIATLITPPCSEMSETTWLTSILQQAGARMLLDLHNLYANAKNTGVNPLAMLDELPLNRITQIHLAGGVEIPAPGGGVRLLDDHVHDVPADVFDLLEVVASRAPGPLMVIIERDGRYPDFAQLVEQISLAKAAIRRGRVARGQLTAAVETA